MESQLTPLAVPISEAQRMLGGISRTSVYDLAKSGQLKKINIGRRGLITVASIGAFVDRLAETHVSDEPHDDLIAAAADMGNRVAARPNTQGGSAQ